MFFPMITMWLCGSIRYTKIFSNKFRLLLSFERLFLPCNLSLQPNMAGMKKFLLLFSFLFFALFCTSALKAQCSICTKTASQLGEKQGKGLNGGIIYLMLTPFAVGGFIGYRWWKNEKVLREESEKKSS